MSNIKLFFCSIALDYYQAVEKLGVKLRAYGHEGASKCQAKVDKLVKEVKK